MDDEWLFTPEELADLEQQAAQDRLCDAGMYEED